MKNLLIEDARLAFKNFSGKEGKFNREGDRNFCVLLNENDAKAMEEDGWNIKHLKPRDPEDKEQPYIKISVNYNNRPPKVVMLSSRGKTLLNEESVGSLDWAEIGKVDLMINPYQWEMNGNTGIKAYLKSMYVTIVEDELEQKYINHPDSAEGAIGGCGGCDMCDGSCHEN